MEFPELPQTPECEICFAYPKTMDPVDKNYILYTLNLEKQVKITHVIYNNGMYMYSLNSIWHQGINNFVHVKTLNTTNV